MSARFLLSLLLCVAVSPAGAGEFVARPPRPIALVVQDRAGKDLDLKQLAGKITLVHFWASWCLSCREEFPALDALQRDMGGEGLKILAISLDRIGWPKIDRTIEKTGVRDLAVFHDRNRDAATALGVVGLPTTLLVDAQGREVARMEGPGAWGDAALRARIRAVAAN